MATLLILEPLFEADFLPCSFGFRPGRSAHQALDAVRRALDAGYSTVYDADLEGYFDSIPHEKLLACLRMRIADRTVLRLIRRWLDAPGVEAGDNPDDPPRVHRSRQGTPQGGVISPLLANLYLHWLDKAFHRSGSPAQPGQARLVRYADDCAPRRRGEEALMQKPTRSSPAAQEMRAGPSDSGCRTRVQTTGSCSGPMAGVVSVSEKAGHTRQVCAGKANVSEPLTTCRKRRDVIETRLLSLVWDEARERPADCPSGDRHEGGASPAQALVRNVGTSRLDAEGELRAEDP